MTVIITLSMRFLPRFSAFGWIFDVFGVDNRRSQETASYSQPQRVAFCQYVIPFLSNPGVFTATSGQLDICLIDPVRRPTSIHPAADALGVVVLFAIYSCNRDILVCYAALVAQEIISDKKYPDEQCRNCGGMYSVIDPYCFRVSQASPRFPQKLPGADGYDQT